MDGTVNDANLDDRAFDCAGAVGDKTLVSGGTIFDAMTMGCFKFDSSLDDLETVFSGTIFVFSTDLAGLTGLVGLTTLVASTAFCAFCLTATSTTFAGLLAACDTFTLTTGFVLVAVLAFTVGFASGLLIFLAATFETVFATVFALGALGAATGFFTGFATVSTTALTLVSGLDTDLRVVFTGLTVFFAATLVTTLAAVLTGAFLTAFFATVFIHCLPAKLVFIQIKQSTLAH